MRAWGNLTSPFLICLFVRIPAAAPRNTRLAAADDLSWTVQMARPIRLRLVGELKQTQSNLDLEFILFNE